MTYESNLKEILKQKYGTFKAAADALGVSRSYLGQYTSGRRNPSPIQLERFERVLGLKITVTVRVEIIN